MSTPPAAASATAAAAAAPSVAAALPSGAAAAAAAPSAVAAAATPAAPVAVVPAPPPPFTSIGELSRGGAQLGLLCSDLQSLNACIYCVLRFANVRQERAYQQTKAWLHTYTTTKLGWTISPFSDDGCPLCLDVLSRLHTHYWPSAIRPDLLDDEGRWRFEVSQFSVNISEPVLARIRQFATFSVLKGRYSRLQAGFVDLKDAIKWMVGGLLSSAAPSVDAASPLPPKMTNSASPTGCEFGILLTYTSLVPDAEYGLIVRTLPRNEQAATVRAKGDYAIPSSNNLPLAVLNSKDSGDKNNSSSSGGGGSVGGIGADGRFKKKGKKNPRQDVMGQKTVNDALPKVKPEAWEALDMFEPLRRKAAAAAAAAAASSAAAAADSTGVAATPAAASTGGSSSAMDTSEPGFVALAPVPEGYPLPLKVQVPPPALTVTVHREPVLVCGHYRKLYRSLSQTLWKLQAIKAAKAAASSAPSAAGGAATPTASPGTVRTAAATGDLLIASSPDAPAAGAAAAAAPAASESDEEEDDLPSGDEDDDAGDDDDDEGGDGSVRVTDSSVEEEIVRHVLEHFRCAGYKFHSSGREDMDVRMLGNGRLFFLEFAEARRVPRSPAFYSELQAHINSSSDYVEVLGLHLASKQEFARMKQDVALKRKSYRCVCWTDAALTGPNDPRLKKLDQIKDLTVMQRTPIRVLHRRSLLTRKKTVYSARAEYINPHWFLLDVLTSAGAYVKEFVHGDRGRTVPSVGSIIGARATIIQLDVIGFDKSASDKV